MSVMSSISVMDGDYTPTANVLMCEGEPFISLALDNGYASVVLPFRGAKSAEYALKLAHSLMEAAYRVKQIQAEPETVNA